jgi:hypothetical protein
VHSRARSEGRRLDTCGGAPQHLPALKQPASRNCESKRVPPPSVLSDNHVRLCTDIVAIRTSSALQEQPRLKLEAWNRFCRKAPTLVLTSLRYLLFLSVDLCPRLIFKDLQKKEKAGLYLYRKKSVRSFSRLGWSPSAKGLY